MARRMKFRRPNGRFRRAPSLEEMGFDVAKGPKRCECGHIWRPVLVTGTCPECDSAKGEIISEAEANDG